MQVERASFSTSAGFTLGDIVIEGVDANAGSIYRIAVRNENMAAWLDEEVAVTIPDLICLFDTDTGEPVTNPNATAGMQVAVVLLPAPVKFTTDRALSVFGPSYAGIDRPYVPAVPKRTS